MRERWQVNRHVLTQLSVCVSEVLDYPVGVLGAPCWLQVEDVTQCRHQLCDAEEPTLQHRKLLTKHPLDTITTSRITNRPIRTIGSHTEKGTVIISIRIWMFNNIKHQILLFSTKKKVKGIIQWFC